MLWKVERDWAGWKVVLIVVFSVWCARQYTVTERHRPCTVHNMHIAYWKLQTAYGCWMLNAEDAWLCFCARVLIHVYSKERELLMLLSSQFIILFIAHSCIWWAICSTHRVFNMLWFNCKNRDKITKTEHMKHELNERERGRDRERTHYTLPRSNIYADSRYGCMVHGKW